MRLPYFILLIISIAFNMIDISQAFEVILMGYDDPEDNIVVYDYTEDPCKEYKDLIDSDPYFFPDDNI